MHKRNQIIVVTIALVLMGVLLMQPIKGLVNDEDETTESSSSSGTAVSFTSESQRAKQGLNPSIIQDITDLESALANAESEQERVTILEQLAETWDSVEKHSPVGFSYEELARITNSPEHWLKAGNGFRAAFNAVQDTSISNPLTAKSIHAYQQVLEQDSENLDAKAGLGAAYVGGSANPMAGITLLQEVIRENPKHLDANKSLGLFSMQSRQFDKAIDRFLTVVELSPDAESYFYLATSYENIGLKKEAVAAFEKSKQLAADPTLNQFIDRKIEELTK